MLAQGCEDVANAAIRFAEAIEHLPLESVRERVEFLRRGVQPVARLAKKRTTREHVQPRATAFDFDEERAFHSLFQHAEALQ